MSQPSSEPGQFPPDFAETSAEMQPEAPAPVYRKQGFSIYTVMLILSFVFLTAGLDPAVC